MTSLLQLFFPYTPYPQNLKINIVDGSLSFAVGKGLIIVINYLTLTYVPNVSHNLLSIDKLTNDLNCVANFFLFVPMFREDDWQC